MINSVEIGKNYAIRLLEFYGGTKQNVNVIGITNIDNVSLNQDDYNIYQTYFAPIGLGMTSYYTAIHEDTKIYICKVISSLEPYELEDDKIFIPESLIDMNTSDELIKSLTFTFSISPVIRRFQSEEETGEFTREIEEKIKKAFNIVLGKEKEEPIKTFSFSVNETYEIYRPGKGKRSGQSGALLPNFIGKTVNEAQEFCKNNNITLDIKYVDSGNEHYNNQVSVGLIGDQSVHKDVLLSTVSNLTIYVVNSKTTNNNSNNNASKSTENKNDNSKSDAIIKGFIDQVSINPYFFLIFFFLLLGLT